jgi:hypothetical protein
VIKQQVFVVADCRQQNHSCEAPSETEALRKKEHHGDMGLFGFDPGKAACQYYIAFTWYCKVLMYIIFCKLDQSKRKVYFTPKLERN